MNYAAHSPTEDYERSDAAPRVVALTALVLALGVIAALVISAAMYVAHYRLSEAPRALGAIAMFQHGNDEHTSIAESWADQDAAVRDHLHGYGWTEKNAGIAHIPIERAIDLLVQEQRRGAPNPADERRKP